MASSPSTRPSSAQAPASKPVRRASSPTPSKAPRTSTTPRQVQVFLRAQLGKPWMTVQDEFKRHFKLDGSAAAGALRKLDVAVRTVLRDGKVRVQQDLMPAAALEDVAHEFFIEPTTKVLCLNEPRLRKMVVLAQERQRRELAAQENRRELTPDLQAHKRGHAWVVVELKALEGTSFDVMLGRNVTVADARDLACAYGKAGVFAAQKRELTYREQHQLGLA